ncbi:MAG: proline permease [Acidobacteriota bacterium]
MSGVVVAGYLAILVWVGWRTRGASRDAAGFFAAGRGLGTSLLVLTLLASIMSGFTFVGGPALFARVGVSSLWIVLSASFTGGLMAWLYGGLFHRLAVQEGCLTVPDVLAVRFGGRDVARCAAAVTVVGSVAYLAVQVRALDRLLEGFGRLPGGMTVAHVCLAILVLYSWLGGMRAGVLTDALQGLVMVGVAALCVYVPWNWEGGVGGFARALTRTSPDLVSPWGTVGPGTALGWFFLFAVGSLGQPHVVNRFLMVRDPEKTRWFPVLLALVMGVCTLVWVVAGGSMAVLTAQGGLDPGRHPDEAVVRFLEHVAPSWLVPLFLVAAAAAVMSTADSFLTAAAAAVAHDLGWGARHPRGEVFWARITTLALVLVAAGVAYAWEGLLVHLGVFSFGAFAAALTPVLTAGLYLREVTRRAALVSMGVGFAGVFVLQGLTVVGRRTAVPPELLAMAAAFLVLLLPFGRRVGSDR